MEGARRPPPRIRKLSQRSVYLNPFLFLYRFILSSFVSVTIEYDRSICIHGAILLTSRFLIYLLFNKTAHSGARYISLFIVAPSLHPPLAISYVYHSPHRIEACPYNVTRNCQLISNAIWNNAFPSINFDKNRDREEGIEEQSIIIRLRFFTLIVTSI